MAKQLQTLVVPLRADASGFRRELLQVRSVAARETASISQTVTQIGRSFGQQVGPIRQVGDEIIRFGGQATQSLGPLGQALSSIGGALGRGSLLLAGLTAVGAGIGALAQHIGDLRKETEHLEALQRMTGITAGEVRQLQEELGAVGVKVSGLEAAGLARLAQEARISKEEILANRDAIQALATLEGISFDSAAAKFFQDLGTEAKDAAAAIQSYIDAIDRLQGVRRDTLVEQGQARLDELRAERDRLRAELDAARRAPDEAFRRLQREDTTENWLAWQRALERLPEIEARHPDAIHQLEQQIALEEALLQLYQQKREEAEKTKAAEAARVEEERRRETERAQAQARELQAIDTRIAMAKAAGDAEGVITAQLDRRLLLLQRMADAGHISDEDLERERVLAVEQAERDKLVLVQARVRAQEALEFEHRARMAALTDSRLDDIEVAYAKELSALEQMLEDKLIAAEEYHIRLAQMEEYYAGLRQKTQAAERAAQAEQDRREEERRERQQAAAISHGFNVGSAFIHGLRRGLETGDGTHILRGLFGALAMGAAIFGGPAGAAVAGAASLFAGFFSEGGEVRGRRSSRRDNLIAAVEDGEFIVNRRATARHRRLLEAINSGSFVGAFATGGLVSAAAGGGGGTTQIFVAALDPQQTADVLAQRLEPAQRQRGMTRQDEALVAQARPRLLRRTGRRR